MREHCQFFRVNLARSVLISYTQSPEQLHAKSREYEEQEEKQCAKVGYLRQCLENLGSINLSNIY